MGGTGSIFTVERTEYKILILPWGGRLRVRRRKTGIESHERILNKEPSLEHGETAHAKEKRKASWVTSVGIRMAEETTPGQAEQDRQRG